MFFTQEDYKKIQQWLTKNSVKDTEFNEANMPFNGNEIVSIVQGTQNKRVLLKDLVSQIFNLGVSDFVNITDKYNAPNISLEEAIRLIPSRARKEGQVITFLDREDHWHIYQFKGVLNQWNILDQWEDLFDWEKLIINSILPDEEDLTKSLPDENGNSYLSLKDREYNPEDFSGLGKIILRKNIVDIEDPIYGKVKKNILYQDMINKENTIYEIRYDFDLNNEEITIPEGCILDFQGGSFNNGNIKGNNTTIKAELVKIFGLDINLLDSWNVSEAYPEWFGAKGDGVTNDTNSVKKTIAYFDKIQLKNHYIVSERIVLHSGSFINGYDKAVIESDNSVLISKIFSTNREENCNSVTIKGISFVGHCSTSTDDESGLVAIELQKTTDVLIDTCSFTGFNKNIELTECSNYVITDNIIYNATKTHPNNINGYGVLLEACPFGVIKNNKMNSIQRHCVYVNGGYDIVIKNNYLEIESDYSAGYEGVVKVISHDVIISDNHMIGGVYGVGLDRGFDNVYTKLYNINICNNIIENGHSSASLVSSSITFNISNSSNLVEYKDIKISNNIFIGNEDASISNYGAVIFERGTSYENIIIDKNIARGFLSSARAPFDFRTSGTFTLTNNIVVNSTRSYIFESSNTRIIGKNNSYQNSGSPSGSFLNTREYYLEPIFDISTGRNWKSIKNNTIDATTDNYFVYVNSSNPAVITQIQGGFRGQVIHILCLAVGAIRLVNGELIKLKNGIDFYPDTDSLSVISLINNGGAWFELNRCYYSSNKNYGPWNKRPINKSLGTHYFCTDKQTPEQAAISEDLKGIDIIFKGQDTTNPDNPKDIWVDALGRVIS